MTQALFAASAYQAVRKESLSPRAAELQIFSRVTRAMELAQEDTSITSYYVMAKAIHENNLLWNALAADVAHPDNHLPTELRGQIFYLAEFAMTHSQKILDKQADALPLIDINKSIIAGLMAQGG